MEWKNIFGNQISHKGLVYKEHIQLNSKRRTDQNGQRT